MAETQTLPQGWLEKAATADATRIAAHGIWSIDTVASLAKQLPRVLAGVGGRVVIDFSDVAYMDTAGAWMISSVAENLRNGGAVVEQVGVTANVGRLLQAVEPALHIPIVEPPRTLALIKLLEMLGRATTNFGRDFLQAMSILGGVVRALLRALANPTRFRFTSIVYHLDRTGLQAVPIVCLISVLIGGIIAQQGVFQLSFFGAEDFVVDLVGILILREIGVLLTAIMLAGRSGSAYTAEIGSMKMREELDALKVIGLDPIEVLIMPRLLALVIALPILTFISDMCGLIGGSLVAFIYGDMSFQRFILLLRDAIDMSTLMTGLIKAPFMGLIVGLIAATEGLNVEGQLESLGRQTTSSVVKAIFMVIVADGIFAIFFAAIDY